MIKFLADMCLPMSAVRFLREQGYDIVHLSEENLHRIPDEKVFDKAAAENRVILTFDLDFGEIVSLSKSAEVSVVLFRLHNTSTSFVLNRLKSILPESLGSLAKGAVIIVEDDRYRVRHLPM